MLLLFICCMFLNEVSYCTACARHPVQPDARLGACFCIVLAGSRRLEVRKYALKKTGETMKDAGPDKGRVLLSVWDAEGMRACGWFA